MKRARPFGRARFACLGCLFGATGPCRGDLGDLRRRAVQDQNTVAVVDLMLDDLGGEAGIGLAVRAEGHIPELHLDGLPADRLPGAGEGKASLLRLIGPAGAVRDDRVQHGDGEAVQADGDDALMDADHVGGHAQAMVQMGTQGVQQVPGNIQVFLGGRLAGAAEEQGVCNDGTDHMLTSKASYHDLAPGAMARSGKCRDGKGRSCDLPPDAV